MSAELQELLRQVAELSPDDIQQLRQQIDAMRGETPEQALSRKLREKGLVRISRLPRKIGETIDSAPAVVTGEPISHALVRERR